MVSLLFAALSGLLSGLSHPLSVKGIDLPDLGFLGFFCWVPLFWAIRKSAPWRAFQLGLLAGVLQCAVSFYWLYTALDSFGRLSSWQSFGLLCCLFLVLAAFLGAALGIARWIQGKTHISPLLVFPVVWVACDFVLNRWPFGGFPWGQAVYSQSGFLPFLQIADATGVYGVTALLVFVNQGLCLALERAFRAEWGSAVRLCAGLACVFVANLGYGYFRLAQTLPPVGEIRVGIVQPNVTHERKWAKSFVPAQFEDLREDSLALESDGVELLVWPESALPVKIPENTESLPSEIKLERAGLLFGAVAIADDGNGVPAEKKYFNSAWLSDESGAILGKYRKQHLVPVGEYIPWKRIFTSAKSLTSPMGEVLPGGQGEPLQFHGKALGILICYEDIFPEIARRTVGLGAEILVELTNDAWYGWSGASRQHLAISQLRSIETRREGLRAANSGISALIDRKGRVLWQSVLFQRQAFASGLRLYRDLSFYARFGDVFAYFSLAFTGLMMVIAWSRK